MVAMPKQNVPALRLEGFSGEWERVSVDEVATRHDNERIPVTQKDRIPGPTPYYGANGIQDYVRGFTHEGPLVLVAEDGANDLSNYPVQYVTGYAWVNNHAHVLRCKPKIADDYFLKVALSHSDIKSLLVGGGRAKLNAAQLMQISFCKPTLEEQQAIGAIFTNLDAAINQHTLKHKALQQAKTALMQRMFPQEGQTVPELRLEGFSGEWERVSVDEVATRHDNERIPVTQKDRIPGPTPYYGANGIQDYVRGFTHEGPLVLVAEDGANDLSNYPVQYVTGYAWVNNHAHVLRCKPKIADDYFLKVALSHSDIKSLLVGGGRAKLNAAQLMQISFCKPTLEEQQAIGAIFTNLDQLIAAEAQYIASLKQAKTALLQRMFI